jgi:hypothetical protein
MQSEEVLPIDTFGGAIVTFPHEKMDVFFEVQMAHVLHRGDEPWIQTYPNS